MSSVQYNQQYYADNREQILRYQQEKVQCECGCVVARSVLTKHKKTQKHLALVGTLAVSSPNQNIVVGSVSPPIQPMAINNVDKYEHRKALNRARAAKYYATHKAAILSKKVADRADLKRLRDEKAAAEAAAQPAP